MLVVPWVAVWESGQRLIFVVGLVRLIRFPEMVTKTLDADAFNTSTDDRCVKVPSRSLTDRGQCVPFEAHLHSFSGSAVVICVAHFGNILLRIDRQPGW